MSFICEQVSVLEHEGHQIPDMHRLHIARVFALETMQQVYNDNVSKGDLSTSLNEGVWADFIVAIVPGHSKKTRSKGFLRWSAPRPAFCLCFDTSVQEQSEVMKELWVASLFNKEFWKMMANVNETAQQCLLKSWGCSVLAELQTVESVGDLFRQCFEGCKLALHGILSLVNATPGFGSLEAVNYVVPRNATSAPIMVDIPRQGRAIVSAIRKDKPDYWRISVADFKDTVGPSEAAAQDIMPMMQDVQHCNALLRNMPVPSEDSLKKVQGCVVKVARAMPDWIATLRPGAVRDLQTETCAMVHALFSWCKTHGHIDHSATYKVLKDIVPHLDDDALVAEIGDAALSHGLVLTSNRVVALVAAIEGLTNLRDLNDLAGVLAGKPQLNADANGQCRKVCGLVIRWFGEHRADSGEENLFSKVSGAADCMHVTAATPGEQEFARFAKTLAKAQSSSQEFVFPPHDDAFSDSGKEAVVNEHSKDLLLWQQFAAKDWDVTNNSTEYQEAWDVMRMQLNSELRGTFKPRLFVCRFSL